MALRHICRICDKEQLARIGIKGVVLADGKRIANEDEICKECDNAGDEAKKEALEKRKRK